MKTRFVKLAILASAFAFLLLALTFRIVCASTEPSQEEQPVIAAPSPISAVKSELTAPVQQGAATTATLRAASGLTIPFKMNNNLSAPQDSMPHLVLYRDGVLNPNADERTLIVEVRDIKVPPGGVTVTVKAETQHGDPDLGGGAGNRMLVWSKSRWITATSGIASATFVHEFTNTVTAGVDTPTDYFRYVVYTDTSALVPVIGPVDHAFLMENQWQAPLFNDYDIRAYYCDMFNLNGISRTQTTQLITQSVVPAAQEVFDTIANDWAWGPMHVNWDKDKVVEVMVGDGSEWFHLQSTGAHWSRDGERILTGNHLTWPDNYIGTDSDPLIALRNGYRGWFSHEGLHAFQWNRKLVFREGTEAFIEGHAQCAASVINQTAEFSITNSIYMASPNRFLRRHLNDSYNDIVYPVGIYWRFLYEQCGSPDILLRSHDIGLEDFGAGTPIVVTYRPVLNQALPAVGCPFATYEESLLAFARANYALRLENGRCNTGLGDPDGCMYHDPNGMYISPALEAQLDYDGTDVVSHTDRITSSFGIDFVDIVLDPVVNDQPVAIQFAHDLQADAEFRVQLWRLRPGTAIKPQRYPTHTASVDVLTRTLPNADGVSVYAVPVVSTTLYNRLGLIITRIDADEVRDPNGVYSITVSPDADGDGMPDVLEHSFDMDNPDGDEWPNYLDLDSDGDTITDTVEAGPNPMNPLDTDSLITATTFFTPSDQIPDFLDLDSDGDTISDTIEAGDDDPDTEPVDTDGDGTYDYRDFDSDNDLILDLHEAGDLDPATPPVNTNGSAPYPGVSLNDIPDFRDIDADGDGIPDRIEAGDVLLLTEPWDSDGDGTYDFQSWDSDGNKVLDMMEVGPDPLNPVDTDGDTVFDFQDLDNDGDGILDTVEILQSTPPKEWDSDGDLIPDHLELDSDDDTISDTIEVGPDPANPVHHDDDQLPDYRDLDSDGDYISDEFEAACSVSHDGTLVVGLGFPCNSDATDVLSPTFVVTDTIPDYIDLDSDGDGVLDSIEAGDRILETPPHDSDHDGIPDFRDPNIRYVPDSPAFDMRWCVPFQTIPWGFDMGVQCGLEIIRNTLASAGITVTADDPPVPGMLFATTPFPTLPPGSAQSVVAATATHTTTSVAASYTTSHTVLSGDLQATWSTDAWAGAQFTSLTAPQAQIYDESNTLVAEGAVHASPPPSQGGAGGGSAVALALGDTLTYSVAGTGVAAFYAPATEGLGVGGRWLTYTAYVRSGAPYGVGLQGAAVTGNAPEPTRTNVLQCLCAQRAGPAEIRM